MFLLILTVITLLVFLDSFPHIHEHCHWPIFVASSLDQHIVSCFFLLVQHMISDIVAIPGGALNIFAVLLILQYHPPHLRNYQYPPPVVFPSCLDPILPPLATQHTENHSSHELFLPTVPHQDRKDSLEQHIVSCFFSSCLPDVLPRKSRIG